VANRSGLEAAALASLVRFGRYGRRVLLYAGTAKMVGEGRVRNPGGFPAPEASGTRSPSHTVRGPRREADRHNGH